MTPIPPPPPPPPLGTDSKTEPKMGKHDGLTQKIIGVFYDVYNELDVWFSGVRLFRGAMRVALRQARLNVEVEVPDPC